MDAYLASATTNKCKRKQQMEEKANKRKKKDKKKYEKHITIVKCET